MATVVYLHGEPDPITQFLRIGFTHHRRLEQLLLAGQFPVARVVVDAAAFDLDRMGAVLEDLHRTGGLTTRSIPFPKLRAKPLQSKNISRS